MGAALTELKLDDPNKHFVLFTDQESTMATSIRFDEYVKSMKGRIKFGIPYQRVPYAEVVQKDKIIKLKKDLTTVRGQVSVVPGAIGAGGLSTRRSGEGMLGAFGAEDQKHLLETTLVNVSELR